MRLLLTSDWQLEFSNLDTAEIAVEELLAYAEKYKPDAIIHCGDVKEHYLHAEVLWVTKFMVRVIQRIRTTGFRFIINLGNHDRLSQSPDSKNWFDILRAAGAETVSTPRWKKVGDGHVAFLPYTANKTQEKAWAHGLTLNTLESKGPKVLIFHTELQDAVLNSSGIKGSGWTTEDLQFDKYAACFGGHLHEFQEVGDNAWYVGSPFCMSWNEVNQRKGHVLADIAEGSRRSQVMSQLHTAIPGWFDAEYLATQKIKAVKGMRIRSRIPVTSRKITDQIIAEEKRLAEKYPEAFLFVIPKLQAAEEGEIQLEGASDVEQVAQYVATTLKEGARFRAKQLVGYLTSRLGSSVAPSASNERLRVLSFKGKNVLTYPEIDIRYAKQGLVLLKGVNRDWPKQSNGAGKTNALSMLPIGMFGQTLKGQVNDEWAREGTEDRAEAVLRLQDGRNRKIRIERERRKHALRLVIDGKDVSSGLTGKEKTGTQGMIERESGFDMNLLLNSIYIDQTIANGFLFGKASVRAELIKRLCNLERYEAAAKLVLADIKANTEMLTLTRERLDTAESEAADLIAEVADLEVHVETSWEIQRQQAQAKVEQLRKAHVGITASAGFYEDKQTELASVLVDLASIQEKISIARVAMEMAEKQRRQWRDLADSGKCPRCGQPSEKVGEVGATTAKQDFKQAEAKLNSYVSSRAGLQTKQGEIQREIGRYTTLLAENESELKNWRSLLAQAEIGAKEEERRNATLNVKRRDLKTRADRVVRLITALRARTTDLSVDREMLEEAKAAFHRSGLPLYIASALCPLLNRAAEEFAETFFESKTLVRFEVLDGEFVPMIVNPNGSKTLKGQSVGESAMAGIIAAFALREAAPKTNLLILDEPGHGLDPVGATQFAKGLLSLKEKYETIIVTTHSPYIEAVLSGETVWTVEKRKGISRLLC